MLHLDLGLIHVLCRGGQGGGAAAEVAAAVEEEEPAALTVLGVAPHPVDFRRVELEREGRDASGRVLAGEVRREAQAVLFQGQRAPDKSSYGVVPLGAGPHVSGRVFAQVDIGVVVQDGLVISANPVQRSDSHGLQVLVQMEPTDIHELHLQSAKKYQDCYMISVRTMV